jgi:ABC-type polar amino acid transport system ATPase subunit
MDIAGAHVVLICGKRGGGKSYTMGVIAEGLAML